VGIGEHKEKEDIVGQEHIAVLVNKEVFVVDIEEHIVVDMDLPKIEEVVHKHRRILRELVLVIQQEV
jgi:hypothetical protein